MVFSWDALAELCNIENALFISQGYLYHLHLVTTLCFILVSLVSCFRYRFCRYFLIKGYLFVDRQNRTLTLQLYSLETA